jgi:nicotinamidase-related amidase
MPITPISLDPNRGALLTIDLQNDLIHPAGLLGRNGLHHIDDSMLQDFVERCNQLIRAVRQRGQEIVFVRTEFRPDYLDAAVPLGWAGVLNPDTQGLVAGTWGAQFVDGLDVRSGDVVLAKAGQDAFHNTSLDRLLTNLHSDQCVLIGSDLFHSISNTLRQGRALGYDFYPVLALPDHIATSLGSNGRLERIVTFNDALGIFSESGPETVQTKPGISALIVVDIQNDFFGPTRHPVFEFQQVNNEEIIANNKRFAEAMRSRGLPVIYARLKYRQDAVDNVMTKFFTDVIRREPPRGRDYGFLHDGTPGADLVPGLGIEPGDIILDKKGHSAFGFTHLHRMLRNLGAGHCYVTGGGASACVSETVRDAAALGYSVTVIQDALYPADSPHVEQVLAKYAKVATTAVAIEELEELFPAIYAK